MSHFNQIFGPRIVSTFPEVPEYLKFDHIPLLMDIYRTGFSIHKFGDLKTANRIFRYANPDARGKNEELMISIAILNEYYNLKDLKGVLSIFRDKLLEVKNLYYGLYPTLKDYDENKYKEIRTLVKSFFQSLPKERDCFKLKKSRILVYGLPQAGISTLIERLNTTYMDETMQIDEIRIARSILGNLFITTFNLSGKEIIDEVVLNFFRGIEGLIFVLDASSVKGFEKEIKELHKISKFPESYNLPLLILLNKSDVAPIQEEEIKKELQLEKLKNSSIHVFSISALNNEGIAIAFSWLSLKILENRTYET